MTSYAPYDLYLWSRVLRAKRDKRSRTRYSLCESGLWPKAPDTRGRERGYREMTYRPGHPGPRATLVLGFTALALLAGCSEPFDMDLRGNFGNFLTYD